MTKNPNNISYKEAKILIDKYYEIIEDLEDYIAIKEYEKSSESFLSEAETALLFSDLLSDEK